MQTVSKSNQSTTPPVRFLSKKDLLAMFGISRATFERNVAVGLFPLPYQVGNRAVRWRSDEGKRVSETCRA